MWPWPAAPADLAIAPGEVHVWAANLSLPAELLSIQAAILDAGERERAARFVQPLHRDRFIAAHAALRQLLGRALSLRPAELHFQSGPQGKPALTPDPGGFQFNLAHSGDFALIAIARGRAVGVDVEHARDLIDAQAIAARFFSANEQAALSARPPAEQQRAFYNIWTRKEAWIKALGQGLSYPLDQFSVSPVSEADDCLLSAGDDPAVAGQWRVRSLAAPPGYAAAVAAEGRDWSLHLWQAVSSTEDLTLRAGKKI